MPKGAPFTREHQAILQSLEVLRLICERIQRDDYVDTVDLQAVIRFLQDVGQKCLDNTEELLLRPALARCQSNGSAECINGTVQRHLMVHSLFDQMTRSLTSATMEEFIFVSNHFTQLLTDLIYDEDHVVAPLLATMFSDSEGVQYLLKFEESEREVSRLSVEHMQSLRKLEAKYVNPHCV